MSKAGHIAAPGILGAGARRYAAVLLALLSGASANSGGAELLTPAGGWVRGPARASLGRLTVAAVPGDLGAGARRHADTTVPVDEIVSLRFKKGAVPGSVEEALVLRNGDTLAGAVRSMQAGEISFVSDSLGSMTLSEEAVRAFSFTPRRLTDLATASSGPPGAVLVNRDFIAGRTVWVNPRTVGVNNGRRIVQAPRARTALVRLATPARAEPDVPAGPRSGSPPARDGSGRQLVRLANGDRLSGTLLSLTADLLELRTEFAGTVKLPVSMVRELWSEGGALVAISTMKPARVRQVPQFDEHFPHRVDRSQAGHFLSVGGRRFERGLGCHSRSEIEYDIGGGFSLFLAEVGIDDHVGRRGAVVFRVLLLEGDETKVAFESEVVRGGEQPRLVRVELGRARALRLVVDFGPDGSSVADHADWGRAVLVRDRSRPAREAARR